jgi:hypothetical protein
VVKVFRKEKNIPSIEEENHHKLIGVASIHLSNLYKEKKIEFGLVGKKG